MTSGVSVGAPVSASPPTNEVLPAGWRRVLLQDVARLESGHTPSRKHPEWWGGDIAWLSLKDVSSLDGKFIEETQDYTNELGIANSSARLLPEGTVCLCRTASVGNAVILGREMATSQDFANWVCTEELDPEYLLAAFLSSQREFAKEKQGSTHKTIYMPTIRNFQVLLPPFEEQHRIVTILDKADALRRERQKSLALMDEFLRSVFLEMFGDPVISSTGYEAMPLSRCGEWMSGGTPRKSSPEYWGGDIPWISAKSLTSLLVEESTDKVTPLGAKNGTKIAPVGSVLFIVRGMSLANEFKVGMSTRDVTFNQDTKAIKPDLELVTPEYLLMALKLSERKILSLVDSASHGTKKLNTRDIGGLSIPLAPLAKQKKFSEFFLRMHQQKHDMNEMLLGQEQLFEALTQRAFRGELTGDFSC